MMKNILEIAADRLTVGLRSALVTVMRTNGSAPRKTGTKMISIREGTK